MDDNYPTSYNLKEIASNVGLKYSTVRNYLNSNSYLIQNNLVQKEKRGYYKGVVKYFPTLKEYLNKRVRSDQLRQIFIDILENQYPLGIHYINAYIRDPQIKQLYHSSNWGVGNNGTNGKDYEIKGLGSLGKTTITLWEGKSSNRSPSIRIIYTGNMDNGEKKWLNRESYVRWFGMVDVFLKNTLNLGYGLDKFQLKQLELNIDLDMSKFSTIPINRIKNVKIQTLNDIVEIYQYEVDGGKKKTRIGKKRTEIKNKKMRKDLMKDMGSDFSSIFMWDKKRTQRMNYLVDNLDDLTDNIKKSNKTLVNQNQKVITTTRTMLNKFGESVNRILTDLNTFKSQIQQNITQNKQQSQVQLTQIQDEHIEFKEDVEEEFQTLTSQISAINKTLSNISSAVSQNASTINQNSSIMAQFSQAIQELKNLNETIFKTHTKDQEAIFQAIQEFKTSIIDLINQNHHQQQNINNKLTNIVQNNNQTINKLVRLRELDEQKRLQKEQSKSKIRKFFERLFGKRDEELLKKKQKLLGDTEDREVS